MKAIWNREPGVWKARSEECKIEIALGITYSWDTMDGVAQTARQAAIIRHRRSKDIDSVTLPPIRIESETGDFELPFEWWCEYTKPLIEEWQSKLKKVDRWSALRRLNRIMIPAKAGEGWHILKIDLVDDIVLIYNPLG